MLKTPGFTPVPRVLNRAGKINVGKKLLLAPPKEGPPEEKKMYKMGLLVNHTKSGNMIGPVASLLVEFRSSLASVKLSHLSSFMYSSNLPVQPGFNTVMAYGKTFKLHHLTKLQGLAKSYG